MEKKVAGLKEDTMDKCPFCGAGIHDEVYFKVFDCMSYVKDGKVWRLSPCYETEIARLKGLVREIGQAATFIIENPYYSNGWVKRTMELAEILTRPEVREIMGGE